MRSLLLTLALVLGLSLGLSPAQATVAVKRDFPALVSRAEQIVVGTVVRISEDDDANGVRRTLVTLGDLSVLKGTVPGNEFSLDFVGGQKGGMSSRVLDAPTFREGDRAVVFVANNGRAVCPLVGIWQGRFRVQLDPERGVEIVEGDDGSPVVGLSQRELRYAPRSAGSSRSALTLDEFRQLVADELAHPTDR